QLPPGVARHAVGDGSGLHTHVSAGTPHKRRDRATSEATGRAHLPGRSDLAEGGAAHADLSAGMARGVAQPPPLSRRRALLSRPYPRPLACPPPPPDVAVLSISCGASLVRWLAGLADQPAR